MPPARSSALPTPAMRDEARAPIETLRDLPTGWVAYARLGSGGFGAVYDALGPEGVHAALKIFHVTRSSAAAQREIDALETLGSHPCVPRLLDAGFTPSGRSWLALEFIEGLDLQSVLEALDGGLQPLNALRVIRDVGAALVHAHGLGLLHGDLKPSNVIRRDDGHAVLVDWGLASSPTRVTASLGTPGFVAPEILDSNPADMRADVYGLGCLLHALLVGDGPFTGQDPVQTLRNQLAPFWEAYRLENEGLGAVVRRATMRKPDDRYASVADFLAALEDQ